MLRPTPAGCRRRTRDSSLDRPVRQIELSAVRHGLIGIMADHPNHHLRSPFWPCTPVSSAPRRDGARTCDDYSNLARAGAVQATVLKGPHLGTVGLRQSRPPHVHRHRTSLVPHGDIEAALEVIAADPSVITIPPKTPKGTSETYRWAMSRGSVSPSICIGDLFSYTQLRGCAGGRGTAWAWEACRVQCPTTLGPLWGELPSQAQLAFLCNTCAPRSSIPIGALPRPGRGQFEVRRWGSACGFRTSLEFEKLTGLLVAERVADAALPVWILIV